MKKFINNIKSNKLLSILSILIIGTFFILISRVTYAYLAPVINDAQTDVMGSSDTVDDFKFELGNPLKLNATPTTLKENGTNYISTTHAKALLKANSATNTATFNYYIYFNIANNTFTYTNESTPEIILTVTDPNGEIVTSIDNLTYGTFNGVQGFDVTTKSGLFNIANNYEITSSSSTSYTTHDWKITLTYLNHSFDQSQNYGKSMDVSVNIRKDKKVLLTDYIISQYTGTQGENGIYYHDSTLTNGAGDNSYRYAGANPNNFVCFGSDASTCPDDNLYRIIGVIDGKVKLIKADYANSNLLGTDGDYYSSTTPNASYYKGKLTSVNTYYWNYKNDTSITYGSNIWSTSLLNKTNLNTNYINNIGDSWANKIATTTWKVGGNTWENIGVVTPSIVYKNEIITLAENTIYDAKIGLMYVSDYMYGATPDKWTLVGYKGSDSTKDYRAATSVNWMYMGMNEWTIAPMSSNSNSVFYLGRTGGLYYSSAFYGYASRPVMYLKASVAYTGGAGTEADPIRMN